MVNPDGLVTRTQALQEARADGLIEGLREDRHAAAVLDTWARGEISGDEARRRLDAKLQADLAKTSKVA